MDATTQTPRARLSGRGKKAGRINAMLRIRPEAWQAIKDKAEAAGLSTGELLERVFLIAESQAAPVIAEMMNEKVWRR